MNMPETLLDTYFNRLKEEPNYLWVSDEWNWGFFNIWELSEDGNELRIVLSSSIRPIRHAVAVSIGMFLLASGLVWFLHGQRVSPIAYVLIYLIVFLTSVLMISFGFGASQSLKKKGRCWFAWNRFQDTVSLPRMNITLSCTDILALQHGHSHIGDRFNYFEIIAAPKGILRRYQVFQLYEGKKQMQVIRTVACRLKKPLIISTYAWYTWKNRRIVTMENITQDKI